MIPSENGEQELPRDTHYWIKHDLRTIKKSLVRSMKVSPIILVISILFGMFVTLITRGILQQNLIFLYSSLFFPILLFGYFMLHILATKGYDIHFYAGAKITNPEKANPGALDHILTSKSDVLHQALLFLRIIIMLAAAGLVITLLRIY